MRSHQNVVPHWKMNGFSRFFGGFYENERFSSEEMSRSRQKNTFLIEKLTIFRVSVNSRLHRGSLEFRILEFWNSHYIDYVDYTSYTDYTDYADYIDYILYID